VKTRYQFVRPLLTAVITTAIAFGNLEAWPQSPAVTVTQPAQQPKALFINILEGEGALNDVRTRTAREPIVEVDDENHKPVAGALVLFALDNGGGDPYATFAGAQTVSVQTDAAGRAAARGFQITHRKGKYNIKVRATKGQAAAEVVIAESNMATAVLSQGAPEYPVAVVSHKKMEWLVGSAVAIGVAIGVVLATRQTQTTITPGTGTVGAPGAVGGGAIHFNLHHHHL
jgi:hypothetical protein